MQLLIEILEPSTSVAGDVRLSKGLMVSLCERGV